MPNANVGHGGMGCAVWTELSADRSLFNRLTAKPRFGPWPVTQKNFADLVKAVIPEHASEKPIELWWQDEARVGQQGTLTRVWAERGSRARPRRATSVVSGPTYSALSVLVAIS